MLPTTLQQAEERLNELRQERKTIEREMQDLRHLIADLSGTPLRKDNRARDRKIYLKWKRGLASGKKLHWLEWGREYNLGPDQLRLIYKHQKERLEKGKG